MDKLIGETYFGVHKVESNNMHYPFAVDTGPEQIVAVFINGEWRVSTWAAVEKAAMLETDEYYAYPLDGEVHRAIDVLVLRPEVELITE